MHLVVRADTLVVLQHARAVQEVALVLEFWGLELQFLVMDPCGGVVQRVHEFDGVPSLDDPVRHFGSSGMQALKVLARSRQLLGASQVRPLVIQDVLQDIALLALTEFDERRSSLSSKPRQLTAAWLAIKLHTDGRHRYSRHVLLLEWRIVLLLFLLFAARVHVVDVPRGPVIAAHVL